MDNDTTTVKGIDREILATLVTLSVQMDQVNANVTAINERIDKLEVDQKERTKKGEADQSKRDARLEATYVTKTEFVPYQRLLQGMVALVLSSVFAALLSLIL